MLGLRSGSERPDLRPLAVRFNPEVPLQLRFGEEIRGERERLAQTDAQVHGDRAATVENARDGGARHTDVLGKFGCGPGSEELLEEFAWAGRVMHPGHAAHSRIG